MKALIPALLISSILALPSLGGETKTTYQTTSSRSKNSHGAQSAGGVVYGGISSQGTKVGKAGSGMNVVSRSGVDGGNSLYGAGALRGKHPTDSTQANGDPSAKPQGGGGPGGARAASGVAGLGAGGDTGGFTPTPIHSFGLNGSFGSSFGSSFGGAGSFNSNRLGNPGPSSTGSGPFVPTNNSINPGVNPGSPIGSSGAFSPH